MDDQGFYAVFVESKFHVEGDERSRTHPGHGYPAHDVTYTEVIEFKDAEGLKDWVRQNSTSYTKKKFKAVKCSPLAVTTSVDVQVEIAG